MHLTQLESNMFCSIPPIEFVRWHRDDHTRYSPHIEELTVHFNEMSGWIQTQLAFSTRLKQRSKLLAQCILLAKYLYQLQNFNGLMEVISALNSSAVRRMARTFASLDKSLVSRFQKLCTFMSHQANFQRYREFVKTACPPIVPYVGVYLQDIRFLADGLPSTIKSPSTQAPLIHWAKHAKLTRIAIELHRFQQSYQVPSQSYDLRYINWLQQDKYISSEQSCYEMSKRVDPNDYEQLVEDLIERETQLKLEIERLKGLLGD
mmetsp:Transcript_10230/g.15419  ORF Transcript_10230/g.15419 Transcript_10230/m.15419 type:complete len:262 (+) Transcript_10230:2-787(+)